MTSQQFTPAAIRAMEVMRDRGKTYSEIAFEFECSINCIHKILTGQVKKYELSNPPAPRKERKPTPPRRHCNITCCNDRKSCTEIEHPEQCLVWRLYNDKKKQSLPKESLKKGKK